MSEDIPVDYEPIDEIEVTSSMEIPTPVGGGGGTGIPEETIRAWDNDILNSARSYTDSAVGGIVFPETPPAPVQSVNDKTGAVQLNASDVGAATTEDISTAIDAIVLPEAPETPTWDTLDGKPTTFPPSTHQHSASDTTSGVFPPARLGTGTTDAGKVLYGDGAWRDAPTGGGGSSGLTGPGRPDMPAGTGLAAEIAAAPVGTLYNSTDGAGAGAWAWRKRPAGWVVVDGDTGLRRFVLNGPAFPANGSYVEYRRRQDAVSFQVNSTNAGAWRINAIPSGGTVGVLSAQPGFRPSSGAMAELNSDGRARLGAFLMQLPPNDGGGALQIRPFEAIAPNNWVRVPLMTWLTLDDWPTTLPGTPA